MRGSPVPYTDFGGGLDTKSSPYLLDPRRARDLLNVQSLTAGGITKRDGLVTFARPSAALTSLYPLEVVGPALIGHAGTTLVSIDGAGAITTRRTGVSPTARWEWVQTQVSGGQGPLYGMNGIDTPQQWNGAAASTSDWTATAGAVPNGRYLALHQNYVFVAGTAANPSRLYWCNIAAGTGTDPRSWPAANVVDLDPNDGDQITGIGKAGSLLLVFKRRKIFAIYDPATGANRRISDSIGSVSHRSIAEAPGGTMFLAENGVWRTNGSTIELVSDAIAPTLATLAQTNTAAAVYFNSHYYLSVGTSGTNTLTLDYDLTLGSWWRHNIGSNQWAVWHPSPTASLFSAKATGAIVDQCFVSGIATDNGTAFQWYWKGPWLAPSARARTAGPAPFFRKRLRQVRCDGNGTVNLSIAVDFIGAETLLDDNIFLADPTAVFGGAGTFGGAGLFGGGPELPLSRTYSPSLVARAFSPVFGATSTSPDRVYSMTLFLQDRKD